MMNIYIICFNDSMELAFPPETKLNAVIEQMEVLKKDYIQEHMLKEFPRAIYVHYHEVKLFGKNE